MTHGIISATPNQIVANKNRKNNYKNLIKEINSVNKFLIKMYHLAQSYYKSIGNDFTPAHKILNCEVLEDNIKIHIIDEYDNYISYNIPKDWINNFKSI